MMSMASALSAMSIAIMAMNSIFLMPSSRGGTVLAVASIE